MENLIEKTYDLAFLVYDSEKHTSVWNVKMVNWLCAPGTTTTVLEFFLVDFHLVRNVSMSFRFIDTIVSNCNARFNKCNYRKIKSIFLRMYWLFLVCKFV